MSEKWLKLVIYFQTPNLTGQVLYFLLSLLWKKLHNHNSVKFSAVLTLVLEYSFK